MSAHVLRATWLKSVSISKILSNTSSNELLKFTAESQGRAWRNQCVAMGERESCASAFPRHRARPHPRSLRGSIKLTVSQTPTCSQTHNCTKCQGNDVKVRKHIDIPKTKNVALAYMSTDQEQRLAVPLDTASPITTKITTSRSKLGSASGAGLTSRKLRQTQTTHLQYSRAQYTEEMIWMRCTSSSHRLIRHLKQPKSFQYQGSRCRRQRSRPRDPKLLSARRS